MQIEVYGVKCRLRKSKRKGAYVGGQTVFSVDLSRPVTIKGVRITEAKGFGYVSIAKSTASLKAALRAAADEGKTVAHSFARAVVED